MARIGRLAGAALMLLAGGAAAKELPAITVQGNAPGWITITYVHSGKGGVLFYAIEREGAGNILVSGEPEGQFTDTNLPPDTEQKYRVCVSFEDDDEPSCTPFVAGRTLPPPGKPANFDPPSVTNVRVDLDKIMVSWGPTGDYTRILLRIDDDRGNLGQPEVKNVANASYTFTGLQPGTRYHIGLKGCSKTLLGSSCGPWSQRVTLTTAAPPGPILPPGKPTLTVAGTTADTITLGFLVKLPSQTAEDRIVLYRDGKPYQQLEGRSAIGGLQGSYTDTVTSRHAYRLCLERAIEPTRTCSDAVRDPVERLIAMPTMPSKSKLKLMTKPSPIEATKPGDVGAMMARPDFTGEWDTVTGGAAYRMVLRQAQGQVTGTYQPGDGTLTSTSIAAAPDGQILITFVWREGGGATGAGRFTLAADGTSFSGSWNPTADPNAGGTAWTGRRATGPAAAVGTAPPALQVKPLKSLVNPKLLTK